ncbi:MAG: DUF4097 domain-containing protein [Aestuariibacter sp.]
MNRLLLVLLLTASSAFAGQRVNETLDVTEDVLIDIEHQNGRIEIRGWDKAQVEVKGELSDKAEDFVFERRGSRVVIEVRMPKRNNWNWKDSDNGDDLVVNVPKGSKIDYSSVNADVRAKDLHNGASIDTVNGEIDVEVLSGRISLESVNGDIESEKLFGDISFETVNGNIRDRGSNGRDVRYESVNGDIFVNSSITEIKVESVNGGIELELGDIQALDIVTVNGNVEAYMNLMENGSVEGTSVSGRMELKFQEDVSARFDVQAHAGGRIVNRFSEHEPQRDKYGPRRWLEFTTGSGKGRVELSTVGGRIILAKHKN